MHFHELQVSSTTKKKRVGRGISAGQGKTAGRGTKGQKARTGHSYRSGFAGGQMPLVQQLPKLPGFKSIRPKAEVVYTGELANVKGTVDNFSLFEAGIVTSPYVRVKVVLKGEVTGKYDVHVQGASANAIEAIKKAGGTFTVTPQVKREKKK